jgi:polysaccharide pyruvyl transferase WcaK-like protein
MAKDVTLSREPFREKRFALLLNFTGNYFHWGCYGTTMELLETLSERGYYTTLFDVRNVHEFTPSAERTEQFDDPSFIREALQANPALARAMEDADLVVVNGEGTLHRLHAGPRNLLFLVYIARTFFGKRVHLINHSFFPSGTTALDAHADAFYRHAVSRLDQIVPRETFSASNLQRLGIKYNQGFDCLPRFIHRQQFNYEKGESAPVVVSGGMSLSTDFVRRLGTLLRLQLGKKYNVRFLIGAKSSPDPYDTVLFEAMRQEFPGLVLHRAETFADWLEQIGTARCLFSGRFHHTIAAAFLDTPPICIPSNTLKVEGICQMLALEPPISLQTPQIERTIAAALHRALDGRSPLPSPELKADILKLAEANFIGI